MIIERHAAVIEEDLPAIYAFIARDNPNAAERVLDAIEATLAHLLAHPLSGIHYPTRRANLKELRMLPVKGFQNYLVFYRVSSEAVRILYIVNGVRHLHRFGIQ